LGKATRNLGVDLPAFSKNGTYVGKGFHGYDAEYQHGRQYQERHHGAYIDQEHHGYDRGEHTTKKLYQARAYQVSHAFHVGHDARHQLARFGIVKKPHGQAYDFLLKPGTQLSYQVLGLYTQQLGEQERRNGLHEQRPNHSGQQPLEQFQVFIGNDIIYQVLAGAGKNKSRQAVDNNQEKAQ